MGRRLGSLVGVLGFLLLSACATLNDQELYRIATSANSVQALTNTLGAVGKGRVQHFVDQYALVIDRNVVEPQKFRPLLRVHCQQRYGGTLKTAGRDVINVGHNVPKAKLAELAGRSGPITDYLEAGLARSMSGYIKQQHQELKKSLVLNNKRVRQLYELSEGVCVSYRQGLLRIHFSAVLLSEEPMSGKAPLFWGIVEGRAYDKNINREIAFAQTNANKKFWEERETAAYYEGETNEGALKLNMRLTPLEQWAEQYTFEIVANNLQAEGAVLDFSRWQVLRTAAGDTFGILYDEREYPKAGQQVSPDCLWKAMQMAVAPGAECKVRWQVTIPGMKKRNLLLSLQGGERPIDLKPVSVYFNKYGTE